VGTLIFLFFVFAALILLPLLLVKLVVTLILLPFQLVGLLLRVVFGVLGGVFRVGFGIVGLLFGLMAAAFFLVFLPLLPFLLLAGFVWVVARLLRPRPALRVVA
jgi:hypothetical protein